MEKMYNTRDYVMNILSYVYFSTKCHVINNFSDLIKKLVNNILLFLSHKFQDPLNGKNSI